MAIGIPSVDRLDGPVPVRPATDTTKVPNNTLLMQMFAKEMCDLLSNLMIFYATDQQSQRATEDKREDVVDRRSRNEVQSAYVSVIASFAYILAAKNPAWAPVAQKGEQFYKELNLQSDNILKDFKKETYSAELQTSMERLRVLMQQINRLSEGATSIIATNRQGG